MTSSIFTLAVLVSIPFALLGYIGYDLSCLLPQREYLVQEMGRISDELAQKYNIKPYDEFGSRTDPEYHRRSQDYKHEYNWEQSWRIPPYSFAWIVPVALTFALPFLITIRLGRSWAEKMHVELKREIRRLTNHFPSEVYQCGGQSALNTHASVQALVRNTEEEPVLGELA